MDGTPQDVVPNWGDVKGAPKVKKAAKVQGYLAHKKTPPPRTLP